MKSEECHTAGEQLTTLGFSNWRNTLHTASPCPIPVWPDESIFLYDRPEDPKSIQYTFILTPMQGLLDYQLRALRAEIPYNTVRSENGYEMIGRTYDSHTGSIPHRHHIEKDIAIVALLFNETEALFLDTQLTKELKALGFDINAEQMVHLGSTGPVSVLLDRTLIAPPIAQTDTSVEFRIVLHHDEIKAHNHIIAIVASVERDTGLLPDGLHPRPILQKYYGITDLSSITKAQILRDVTRLAALELRQLNHAANIIQNGTNRSPDQLRHNPIK